MADFEANDNNIEDKGIIIQIRRAEIIVLPIPEKKPNANTPVEIDINIGNSNPTPFRFNRAGTLIPQIVGTDGQFLHIQASNTRKHINKDYNYLVQPGNSIFYSVMAKLFWQNNKLQLQITDIHNKLGKYWIVDDIKSGDYQLRFIYTTNMIIPGGEETVRLKTQFITLRLTEPIMTDKSVIEVDGVQFETLVPQRVLTIPKKQHNTTTPVQFGLRVTNLSSTPYRFIFHGLMPEFQSMDGKLNRRLYNRNVTIRTEESHFLLAMPGETLTSFVDGELYWDNQDELVIRGTESMGGFWFFQNLKSETWGVRFTYRGPTQSTVATLLRGVVIENLWTGIVPTPFVDFQLAR